MPKIKTSKGVAKRFRLTKKKKLKMAHAFKSHILSKKRKKRKRHLRREDYVSKADKQRIRRLLGI